MNEIRHDVNVPMMIRCYPHSVTLRNGRKLSMKCLCIGLCVLLSMSYMYVDIYNHYELKMIIMYIIDDNILISFL